MLRTDLWDKSNENGCFTHVWVRLWESSGSAQFTFGQTGKLNLLKNKYKSLKKAAPSLSIEFQKSLGSWTIAFDGNGNFR